MTALASDNFNRANENPLGNGVWSTASGQNPWQIVSNAATPTVVAGTDDRSYYSGIAWPNDQYSQAKLTVNLATGAGSGNGLSVRQSSSVDSSYGLIVDHGATTNVAIIRRVAGVGAVILSVTQAWTDGATWRFEVQGTALRGYLNGALVISTTDPNITSGSPGLWLSTDVTSALADDWEGGDFSIAGGAQLGRQIYIMP